MSWTRAVCKYDYLKHSFILLWNYIILYYGDFYKQIEAKRSRSKPRSNFKDLKKISDKTLHSDAITIAWKAVRETVALKLMGKI